MRPPRLWPVTGGDCVLELDSHAVHDGDSTGSVAAVEDNAVVVALLDAALDGLALLDVRLHQRSNPAPASRSLTGAFGRATMLIARTWDPPQQVHRARRHALRCSLADTGMPLQVLGWLQHASS